MAIVLKDRVKETSSSTGTGTFTLAGAAPGYQSFAAIGDGNQTYYAIYSLESNQWEVGTGTYTASGTTLSRTTVFESSNAGALVDFAAGVKDVFVTYPAERAIYEEPDGQTLIDGGPITVLGAGVTSNPSLEAELGKFVGNVDSFGQVYNMNQNDGSSASADFVVYNDLTTDGFTNFTDMGINSSNYSSVDYPIFTPGSGYFFHDGDNLFIGTQTANKDVVLFAGGVDTVNEAIRIKGTDQSVELASDLTVTGALAGAGGSFTLPVTSSSTSVLTPANNEFVTKAYVDNAASAGLHIHTPVAAETSTALSAVYTQGGTTFNITDITGTDTVVTSTTHGLAVDDEIWLTTTAGNGLSINTPYFVYATPTTTSLQLTATWNGPLLTGLTNASGLSYATRANSGVGAYLEASANEELPIAGVSVSDRVLVYQQATGYWNGVYTVTSLGANDPGGSKWKLTRATDADFYSPASTNGLSEGDYFFVQSNSEAYVLTTTGPIIIGYTTITYTLFSSVPSYIVNAPLDLTGNTLSLTGVVAATNGGTGTGTVATGDLLYGSATNTWSKLAAGSAYKSLVMNAGGTNVEWNAVALNQSGAVSGALGATNGGTGQNAYAVGDMLYSGTTNTLTVLSGNTTTTKKFLTQTGTGSDSTAPDWGTISGSDVTGAVTTATNLAGGAANRIAYQTGSDTTGFVAAPVSANTALVWNGSALAWGSAGASITDDTTTSTNYYPVWANATSGAMTTAYVSSTKLTFNPGTGRMTSTSVSGGGTILSSSGVTFPDGSVQNTADAAGQVVYFARNSAPTGWLIANGAAVSRTTYATLFAAIGTSFGGGDGSTTFNVPDLRNRMTIGSGSTYSFAGTGGSTDTPVVSHTHSASVSDPGHSHYLTFSDSGYTWTYPMRSNPGNQSSGRSGVQGAYTGISVGISYTGSSGSGANLPPYMALLACIKY